MAEKETHADSQEAERLGVVLSEAVNDPNGRLATLVKQNGKLIEENVQLKTLLAQTQQKNAMLFDWCEKLIDELKKEHAMCVIPAMHDEEFCDVCTLIAKVEASRA